MHTTGTLAEDNIFDSLRHAMMVQTGANGNVFGYNYSANPVQGEGETNLNLPGLSILAIHSVKSSGPFHFEI